MFGKKKLPTTGLVLQPTGNLHHQDLEPEAISFSVHERAKYVVRDAGRFWNPRPIPAGWVYVFAGSNPEPVVRRALEPGEAPLPPEPLTVLPPKGFWAEDVEILTGGLLPHLFGAALRDPTRGRLDWRLLIMLGVGLLAVLVLGAYYFFL